MSSGYALSVKYIFLSFAQQLFANDPVLSWNLDPKSTNIFIGDEYFISNPVIETRPTIILKRSSFKWGQHAIDQMMTRSLTDGNKDFSDVFYGNITYNILSTSAQTAERIADYLFSMLTANRDQFRPKGIMKFIGIIPSRYASTRFPGKPLVNIKGKTMIRRVYEQTAKIIDTVVVATDDKRIENEVKKFGGNVVMTSTNHKSGTDRCAEAIDKFQELKNKNFDVVINIQGDEPFIDPEQIKKIISCFDDDKTQIATLLFSADQQANKTMVFFGAALALITTTAIGVLAGGVLSRYVSPKSLQLLAGFIFVVIGIWTIVKSG